MLLIKEKGRRIRSRRSDYQVSLMRVSGVTIQKGKALVKVM